MFIFFVLLNSQFLFQTKYVCMYMLIWSTKICSSYP